MHFHIVHGAVPAIEQAQMAVAMTQAVLHGPEHALAARQAEPSVLWIFQCTLDDRARTGRQDFVRIQVQDPIVARQFVG
ncbi:MAG TPA: hypothetical protein VFP88_05500, partial [Rhodanobacteraceae bacterium]|nr:hypothetical protein [Rhodanobacteraceae bacterium]